MLDTLFRASGPLPGHRRCWATGLGVAGSACQQERWTDSNYCYYHDKLQRELTAPCPSMVDDEGNSFSGIDQYPVWPLPAEGYVIPSLMETLIA